MIGRGAGCDLIVHDARTSGAHALVWQTPFGPELIAFGRNATRLDGVPVEGTCTLVHGTVISVPGEDLRFECDPGATGVPVWVVAVDEEHPYSIYRGTVSAGGGADDDLRLSGWPAHALRLSPRGADLSLRLGVDALYNGTPVTAGTGGEARIGDEIRIGETVLRILDRVGRGASRTG